MQVPISAPTIADQGSQIIVWVLGILLAGTLGILGLTVSAVAYFAVREFNRKDEAFKRLDHFDAALTETKGMIHEVRLLVAEARTWVGERFVDRPYFDREVTRLEQEDADIRTSMSEEFRRCKEYCPARDGD